MPLIKNRNRHSTLALLSSLTSVALSQRDDCITFGTLDALPQWLQTLNMEKLFYVFGRRVKGRGSSTEFNGLEAYQGC